ncbi:MAG: sugar ABC transporter permease [Treponema sp.]|nr:sugar ABC transporter permease [Treponema sp.]
MLKTGKAKGSEARLAKYGVFFVLPFLCVYAMFNLWPTLYTILLSFTDLKGFETKMHFIGGTNFAALVKDGNFWGAVINTFIMWGFNFAPQLGIALIFAVIFTDPGMNGLKGKNVFRAIFYLPNLLTAASVAILFRSLFAYPIGPINQFFTKIGIQAEVTRLNADNVQEVVKEAINFFRSPAWSRGIVSFIQWWMWCGQTLIMLMAGITSISPSLYESAVVDGATQSQQTWYITLPLLRPMMLFLLVTSIIGGMQLFEIPFLLTDMRGGPDYKIRTMVLYMYNTAFQGKNRYGYASAIAMGVFIITMFFSVLVFFFMQDRSEPKAKK